MERGCILLKNKLAERVGTWAGGIVKRVTPVDALKGELLFAIPVDKIIPRRDGKRPHNYRLVKDKAITGHANPDDIAPLSDHDYLLLLPIESPLVRYEVFVANKMMWGRGLKPGDAVYVSIQGRVNVSAIIRCIVEVSNHSGLLFGVEIKDVNYHGTGTTDGIFKARRYFSCKKNCGLFVALDRVSFHAPESAHTEPLRGAQLQETCHWKTPATNQGNDISIGVEPQFTIGNRVKVYNTNDTAVYGTVRWVGIFRDCTDVQSRCMAVGIETDHPVREEDFENALLLTSQPFKVSDACHGIVYLPEAFVLPVETELIQQSEALLAIEKRKREAEPAAPGEALRDLERKKGFQGELNEEVSQAEEEKEETSQKGKLYKEKELECSQLRQQLPEQSQVKQHLEQQCSLLEQQIAQQSCENQKLRQELGRQLLRIHEDQHLHEEKCHLQEECTMLQQQVVQQKEATAQAEQQCSLLKQQLSQQSQANQKIQQDYGELECQLQNVSEQKKKIQEEQYLLHEEKRHLQEECTMLQQLVAQQSEAAAQAEARYHQEIEDLQHRLDTALAEIQQLQTFSRTQVLVEDINPWKVSRDEVQILNEMGRGAWGYVAKGRFQGQLVAVKSPHLEILDEHITERLQREVRIMTQVRHPNLVRIIAAVFDDQVPRLPPLIVIELLDMNLRAAYQNNRLPEGSRIPIFQDVAFALHYLHKHQEPIIHRDVSAPNILLEELPNGMFKAKVSDFGSANLAKLAQTLAEGAIIYAAPETFPTHDPHSPPPPQTTKIDVYSYGVLLCEVITCQLPDPQRFWSFVKQVESQWPLLHELIVFCTKRSPEDRLTMTQVLDKLSRLPRTQPC